MKNGKVFANYGDANPNNIGNKIVHPPIRITSTLSKARVLRDLRNIDITAFEELTSDDMGANSAKLNQISLIRKLAAELNVKVDCNNLDKSSASKLISELAEKNTRIYNSEVKDISP